MAFHFVNGESFAEDKQIGATGMPGYNPILTGPKASDGTKEYGEKVAGTWEREV